MKASSEQNFSCSPESGKKQTVTATSYWKIADASSSLPARTLTAITNMCIMPFFHKTDDPKIRENRRNSLEDDQITFRNTENSYNMNTRITVGVRRSFNIILVKIVRKPDERLKSRVLPRPRQESRWLKATMDITS